MTTTNGLATPAQGDAPPSVVALVGQLQGRFKARAVITGSLTPKSDANETSTITYCVENE